MRVVIPYVNGFDGITSQNTNRKMVEADGVGKSLSNPKDYDLEEKPT